MISNLNYIAKDQRQRILFFIGVGASIPAGLSGVVGLVEDFRNWLESKNKTDYRDIVEKIPTIIQKWKCGTGDKNRIDIEMLLEVIEKIENRDKDVLPLFYDKNTFTFSNCKGYELISNGKRLLSQEVKKFIKMYFTEKQIKIEYLKDLMVLV